MKRGLQFANWLAPTLAAVLMLATSAFAGELLDRIVASVDHHAILASEWEDEVRLECLLNGRAPQSVTPEERRKALDRLIDQVLIRGQMDTASFPRATPQEVAARVLEIRKQTPSWTSDAGWSAALASYRLSADDVAAYAARQIDILRFLDLRFRPSIHIDRRSVEQYYQEQFLPELHRAGSADVPLKEVSPKIRELLVQQRMDELLATWLHTLRAQAAVRVQ